MTLSWRGGAAVAARLTSALVHGVAGVWRALLDAAPSARLWAKILAVPVLTWVLVHFVHLVVDRPWPAHLAELQLHILERAIEWTAVLSIIATAALAGVALTARRGPAGAELLLTESPADPPAPTPPPLPPPSVSPKPLSSPPA